jgi:TPR repeat protein
MTTATTHPYLPPRYFEKGCPLSSVQNALPEKERIELPSEVMQTIVSSFLNWGDVAKLATVQSSWKNLVQGAASINAEAKWELAQALLQGTEGLQVHSSLAMKYLLELANVSVDDQGMPCLQNDNNTNNNNTLEFFAPAMMEIANCYLYGHGVAQSSVHGLAWLEAAFQLGRDMSAAHRLGVIYERDYVNYAGIEVDVFAAATWFESAAEAGHVESMAELGLCYELGCGKEQSDEKALDWYMKAAEQGNLTAKYSVAEAFEEARGVPQSDEEACLWYYKAAVDGCDDSKLALRRLHDIARIVVPGVAQLFDA